MSSSWNSELDSTSVNRSGDQLATNLLLSAATVPLMMGLLATKALSNFILDISQSSEDILRGNRLPVLNFPHQSEIVDG